MATEEEKFKELIEQQRLNMLADEKDPRTFSFSEVLDESEELKLAIRKSWTPEQRQLMENSRTLVVMRQCQLRPSSSDFAEHWYNLQGQYLALTSLLKTN